MKKILLFLSLVFTTYSLGQTSIPNDIASFYADASVNLIAKYLITGESLGNQYKDSEDYSLHYNWAKTIKKNDLKNELISKFNQIVAILNKRNKSILANLYASACVEWAVYNIDFGSKNANSKDYNLHYSWALNQSPTTIQEQLKNRIIKIFESANKQTPFANSSSNDVKEPLFVPGLVIGLRTYMHRDDEQFQISDKVDIIERRFTDKNVSSGLSATLPCPSTGSKYYLIPCKTGEDPYSWILPPGIVVGLMYGKNNVSGNKDEKVFDHWASSGPLVLGNEYFKKEHGGDLGAGAGEGFYWYESTGNGFSGDCLQTISRLPRGAVIGLKHNLTQPAKHFVWNGKYYDPTISGIAPPQGFVRKYGGDCGAPAASGYYWYEKITEPSQ